MSVFEKLNAINVNGHTEKKNGLTYLSWAWAWAEVKKAFPDAFYTIYESANGWNYHTDGRTCWVKTGVTIEGLEHIEYLPVMDHRNKSIALENVTSFDVNKSIQRSLTKACARHGLGLYVYAGEDLPEDESAAPKAAPRNNNPNHISNIVAPKVTYLDLVAMLTPDQQIALEEQKGKPMEFWSDEEIAKVMRKVAERNGRNG